MNVLPESWQVWLQGLPFSFLPGLLLLLLVPLAFLVLLLRRQKLDVGSLLLYRDLPQRTLFQNVNLEHLWHRWVYALMFIVLALIAAGLSLPQPGQRHLVVLDDSASMAAWIDPARPQQGRLWDQAKAQARSIAEQEAALGRAVVLMTLSDFQILNDGANDGEAQAKAQGQASTRARAGLAQALEANDLEGQLKGLEVAEPRVAPVDIEARLARLGGLATGAGVGRLTVLTDRPLANGIQNQGALRWIDISGGRPAVNLAIVDVAESANPFDQNSRVVFQNLSGAPVSGVRIEARSIKNPVSLPLVQNLSLADNEQLSIEIETLRRRAEVLGSGPIRLSIRHPQDALAVDDSLWLVAPPTRRTQVALVRCAGESPLFERLASSPGLRLSYFGDVTALNEAADEMSMNPAENQPEEGANERTILALGDASRGGLDGAFESFDLVIYDRCDTPPLYEELDTNSIVVDAAISQFGSPDFVSDSDEEAVTRVGWQAPSSRSPVLKGVRRLQGMPLVSPSVRLLPQAHRTVGLLSDLDPALVAGQAEGDFFAPTDLLHSFVAWGGMKTAFSTEPGAPDVDLAFDPDAARMLYLGFDPHMACQANPLDSKPQDMPLAEAMAAAQNGPDDCLSVTLMVINAIEWMLGVSADGNGAGAATPPQLGGGRQYRHTTESLGIISAESQNDVAQVRERLWLGRVAEGVSGAEREGIEPLKAIGASSSGVRGGHVNGGNRVRWMLEEPGLYSYSGSLPGFELSVGLLDAGESRLTRLPVSTLPDLGPAAAGAGRQDLVRLLVLVLLGLMLVELVFIVVRRMRGQGRRHFGRGVS